MANTENIIGEIGEASERKMEKTPTICISLKFCTEFKYMIIIILFWAPVFLQPHTQAFATLINY